VKREDKIRGVFDAVPQQFIHQEAQPLAAGQPRIGSPRPMSAANTPDVKQAPIHREAPKVGRNDPCPCGSGKKYKKCCGD